MPYDFLTITARRLRLPTLPTALLGLIISSALIAPVHGHVAAWHTGMYCMNGTENGVDDQNFSSICNPLYNLTKSDWWFHHVDGCDEFPPPDGQFLELPAQGTFTVELAVNRAFTTLGYNGTMVGNFPSGQDEIAYPALTDSGEQQCITEPNIHTPNETTAAGTVFAISYTSDMSQVTPENLVVFTVLEHTPWRRLATYSVPHLPACPEGGCICAWGWVADGCGQGNMYMQPYRCKVVGETGSKAVARASPPVWCEDDTSKCVQGAKQMVYWQQLDGNNIEVTGYELSGLQKSPTYNTRLGFANGAQTDIFLSDNSASTTSIEPSSTATSSPPSESTSSGAERTTELAALWWFGGLLLSTIASMSAGW
ncbi:hypothetical protein BDQ12DRAFT_689182 [Crucibulum laeve]|uniref:Proteophosphoglycan ppg4 n=1 Tax=Crucibulum laeve TaxID=68775 RepID=A0A5C3LNN6_9AGAR|nr:hypothetical protein BDQ12DRAFT_689182 [Crucibulum laeve]